MTDGAKMEPSTETDDRDALIESARDLIAQLENDGFSDDADTVRDLIALAERTEHVPTRTEEP